MDNFAHIKKHLRLIKKWNVNLCDDTDNNLSFELINKRNSKWFSIWYSDGNNEHQSFEHRPLNHYYYAHFEQDNVWDNKHQCLVSLFDDQWFRDEQEVIYWINLCKRRGT